MIAIQPSTWHSLGLGVATSFAALGLTAIIAPFRTAGLFRFQHALSSNGRKDVPAMMSLFGARDLSLAVTAFYLGSAGLDQELGALILSAMIVCAVDLYAVIKRQNWVA